MSASDCVLPAPADVRIGTTIANRWRLFGVLGAGGAATVYAATHRNGSRVAIKILHPALSLQPEVVARFTKEGHVGNVIDHPGVVKTIDDGVTDDGAPYQVMELLEGESLERRLERGALPPREAVHIAIDVLDVLATVHARGVVHRDIKPANVFLTTDGRVKVVDFGIAHEQILGRKSETVAGYILGTPAFMSPEQARGRWTDVGPASDQFAVGATLFTALTGRTLRGGETITEELLAAMTLVRPTSLLAPELSTCVAAVLDRALLHDPEARFASASEMRDALMAVSVSTAPVTPPVVREPWLKRSSVHSRAWSLALTTSAVVASIVAFAISAATPTRTPPAPFLPTPPPKAEPAATAKEVQDARAAPSAQASTPVASETAGVDRPRSRRDAPPSPRTPPLTKRAADPMAGRF
jgi:serine/threonine protein kinase